MQSLEARKNYKNSFSCFAQIVKDEGVLTLWSGALPRLARLILSGGIVFTMFVPLPCALLVVDLILTFVFKVRENDGRIGYVGPGTKIHLIPDTANDKDNIQYIAHLLYKDVAS